MGHPYLTPDEWLSRLEQQVLSAFRELRELYEQERARREELERAYRRLKDLDELKTTFVARAGAELRQPLGLVIGFLEAALGQLPSSEMPDIAAMLEGALRGAYRLLEYIAPLTAFAELHRQPTAFVEPLPLGQLIHDLLRAEQPTLAERSTEIRLDLSEEAENTRVDGPYGAYILRTLLDFLFAARREGGPLEIRARIRESVLLVELVDPTLRLPAETLAWLNEGAAGISGPQPARPRVDPAVLGLAITRRAAQALGGDLFLRSEGDQGITLSVLLPARPLGVEDQIALLSQALERLPSSEPQRPSPRVPE